MMNVDSVSSTNTSIKKRQLINATNTGYVAATGIGLSMISGMVDNDFLRKNHKVFAGISIAAVAAHLYIVLSGSKQSKRGN